MKILIVLGFLMPFLAVAQDPFGVRDTTPCYMKGQKRSKMRYAEWDCGKLAGVVDCNEKLEMSLNGNLVVTRSTKQPFSGMCETCHRNGILERRVTFVNGLTNGIDTTTYESGCIMVIRSHVQGVENGVWTYYNDSTGTPAWKKTYVMGELDGPQITYNLRGDTSKYEVYSHGILNGQKITYYKGKRFKVANYEDGLLQGAFLVYNKEGKIIEELNYKDGKKNGVQRYYYDDGTLLRTENWDMDSRNGEFKTLYYDQSLQSLENYKKSNGRPREYLSGEIYECPSKDVADEVAKLLQEKSTKAAVYEGLGENASAIKVTSIQVAPQDQESVLKGKKLQKGVNAPYKYKKQYIVVYISQKNTLTKTETREGWFEDRFPDGKIKRRALYKNDVLIEEHVFNEQGTEVRTIGGKSENGGKEDDAMPSTSKGKKGKKK